jgi:hypothetical protein
MSDLKRTLDATVYLLFSKQLPSSDALYAGTLCTGNALRDREDSFPLISHRVIPAGGFSSTQPIHFALKGLPQFYPTKRKLIYCSRTVPEIEKALAELKRLMAYRIDCAETPEQKAKEAAFTGLGLTSRKNLCLHPEVSEFEFGLGHKASHRRRSLKRRKESLLTLVVAT